MDGNTKLIRKSRKKLQVLRNWTACSHRPMRDSRWILLARRNVLLMTLTVAGQNQKDHRHQLPESSDRIIHFPLVLPKVILHTLLEIHLVCCCLTSVQIGSSHFTSHLIEV